MRICNRPLGVVLALATSAASLLYLSERSSNRTRERASGPLHRQHRLTQLRFAHLRVTQRIFH